MGSAFFRSAVLLVTLWLLLSAPVARAAGEQGYLYQWTDDQGVVNLTDSLEKVPSKFRSRATRLHQPEAGEDAEEGRNGPGQQYQAPDSGAGASEDREEIRKAAWQQRMQDARIRLAGAEERLKRAEQELKALQEKQGYGLYGYTPEAQDELDQLDHEVRTARTERDDARNMIENVLPEEARKAGVPPGWLRE